MELDLNTLGGRIRHARFMAGMRSAEKLANIIHASAKSVRNWETNRNQPDSETILMVAEALNVSASFLLGESPYEKLSSDSTFVPNPDKKIPLANNSKVYTGQATAAVLQWLARCSAVHYTLFVIILS